MPSILLALTLMGSPGLDYACSVVYVPRSVRERLQVRDLRPPRARTAPLSLLTADPGGSVDFRLEGMNVNDPGFNLPMLVLDPAFTSTIEANNGGLEAAAGPYAGGSVLIRRHSGSNRFRGALRLRFTPTLTAPRFTLRDDDAVQSHRDPGRAMQATVVAVGPILRDRLFWSAGLTFARSRSILRQTFHASDGQPFAQQDFVVPTMTAQAFVGLDWSISRWHHISTTAVVNPQFARRAFRRVPDPHDPLADAPGLRPTTDLLTGRPTTADGLVNGTLGWDRSNAVAVTSTYNGRSYDDKWEFEARGGWAQRTSIEAWRLDDESLRHTPARTWTDDRGHELAAVLAAEEGSHHAPGIGRACASGGGVVCPVRRWTNGGIGRTQAARSQRGGGAFTVTRYLHPGIFGHGLQAGVEGEHTSRRRELRDSDGGFRRFISSERLESSRRVSAQNYALHVGDRMEVGNHLFITPGVRWDAQDVRDAHGRRIALVAGNVAPRASVVYDWTEEGRSRAYAAFGWYYQQLPLAMFDSASAVARKLKGQYDQEIVAGYQHEVVEDLIVGVRWLHRGLQRAVVPIAPENDERFTLVNPDGAYPRPRRTTDAVTIQVDKRLFHDWLLMAGYTYAHELANYDGFADPLTGLIDRGTRLQYATPALTKNRFGPQPASAPHRGVLHLVYLWDFDDVGFLTTGASVRASSGRPISVRAASTAVPGAYPVHVLPRGAGGRMEPRAELDLRVEYTCPLGDLALSASLNVTNATNAKATLVVDDRYTLERANPIVGGDLGDLPHARVASTRHRFSRTLVQRNPSYGRDLAYQLPVMADVELQLRF